MNPGNPTHLSKFSSTTNAQRSGAGQPGLTGATLHKAKTADLGFFNTVRMTKVGDADYPTIADRGTTCHVISLDVALQLIKEGIVDAMQQPSTPKLPLYLANLKTFFAKKDKMGLKAMKRIEGTPTGDCTTSKKQRFSEKSHASHKTSVRKYIQNCFLNLHTHTQIGRDRWHKFKKQHCIRFAY